MTEPLVPSVEQAENDLFSVTLTGGDSELVSWKMRFEMTFGPEFEYTDAEAAYLGQMVRQQLSGFFPMDSDNSLQIFEAVVMHVRGIRERMESPEGTDAPTTTNEGAK